MPEAASAGSQLQHLLSDPEMADFLAKAPQGGRLLRPLCRALAVPILEAPKRLRLPGVSRAKVARLSSA